MEELFMAAYKSPIGFIHIEANETSILLLKFIDKKPSVKKQSNDVIKICYYQLEEYFRGKRKVFNIPLQLNGTEFQQKVWNQLYKIPFGKTISYAELSKQIKSLLAIRAVAAANGKNNHAIIIPCHRVVGSNGDMVGYAGEIWRKKWLLEHELKIAYGVKTLF